MEHYRGINVTIHNRLNGSNIFQQIPAQDGLSLVSSTTSDTGLAWASATPSAPQTSILQSSDTISQTRTIQLTGFSGPAITIKIRNTSVAISPISGDITGAPITFPIPFGEPNTLITHGFVGNEKLDIAFTTSTTGNSALVSIWPGYEKGNDAWAVYAGQKINIAATILPC
jgi:hypothetical protein